MFEAPRCVFKSVLGTSYSEKKLETAVHAKLEATQSPGQRARVAVRAHVLALLLRPYGELPPRGPRILIPEAQRRVLEF